MDHDRLWKELLTAFFPEFLDLLKPEVAAYLDRSSIEFLDKEVFTDVTSGERHEVDLVVKAKFRGQETHFLMHVETQLSAEHDFPRRMFRYFARLHEKYDLPVYPIALFSYDKPLRREPAKYQVAFPDKKILTFNYATIQLNRMNWRKFARRPNPVASALMAKMRIRKQDRPRVKLECLRLLATLKLDPAQMQLIRGFVDSYLRLNQPEQSRFEQEVAALEPAEKEPIMEVLNEWVERGMRKGLHEGMEKGLHEGEAKLIVRQLQRRFGSLPPQLQQAVHSFNSETLEQLAESLLDFGTMADAQAWVAAHQP